jgi:hypothetical protein
VVTRHLSLGLLRSAETHLRTISSQPSESPKDLGISLFELAEALQDQNPEFQTAKNLTVQGKHFTIMEALGVFEQLQPQTDAKTLKVLLDMLKREITRLR